MGDLDLQQKDGQVAPNIYSTLLKRFIVAFCTSKHQIGLLVAVVLYTHREKVSCRCNHKRP